MKKCRVSLYNGNDEVIIINEVSKIYFGAFCIQIESELGFYGVYGFDVFERLEVTYYD